MHLNLIGSGNPNKVFNPWAAWARQPVQDNGLPRACSMVTSSLLPQHRARFSLPSASRLKDGAGRGKSQESPALLLLPTGGELLHALKPQPSPLCGSPSVTFSHCWVFISVFPSSPSLYSPGAAVTSCLSLCPSPQLRGCVLSVGGQVWTDGLHTPFLLWEMDCKLTTALHPTCVHILGYESTVCPSRDESISPPHEYGLVRDLF